MSHATDADHARLRRRLRTDGILLACFTAVVLAALAWAEYRT